MKILPPASPTSLAVVSDRFLLRVVLLGLLVCFALSAGRWYVTGNVFSGDAVYYFCMLRSAIVDHDLDFENEYKHFHEERSKYTGNSKLPVIPQPVAATGMLPNKYPIGVPLLLLPWYLLGYSLSFIWSMLGGPPEPQGFGCITTGTILLGSMVYGALGLILIFRAGLRYFPRSQVVPAVAMIFGATPLAYYMTMEPLMSHAFAVFAMGLFVYLWLELQERENLWGWMALGGVGALAGLVRYQDVLILSLPLADLLVKAIKGDLSKGHWHRSLVQISLLGVGMIMVLLPQLLVNKHLYGSFGVTGYAGEGFTNWASPYLWSSLFSKESGLILWAPVHAVALWGICRYARESRVGLLFAGYFILQWYLVSSWSSPGQGDSFGNRMLISCSPIFAFGLMQAFSSTDVLKNRKALWGCVALVGLNGVLIGLYCLRIIGRNY